MGNQPPVEYIFFPFQLIISLNTTYAVSSPPAGAHAYKSNAIFN